MKVFFLLVPIRKMLLITKLQQMLMSMKFVSCLCFRLCKTPHTVGYSRVLIMKQDVYLLYLLVVTSITTICPLASGSPWRAGVGIADVTGPASQVGMMGYGKLEQTTAGIHMRLFSRAYVFEDEHGKVATFVSVDVGMMGQLIKKHVLMKLRDEYGLGNTFGYDNVILSATHAHSGPGGFIQYVLLEVTTSGFVEQSFSALVNGIAESIYDAYNNLKPARLFFQVSQLDKASINRSPTSYEVNPKEERDKYDANVDKQFPQLTILDKETLEPIGIINWFAVHPVSMNSTNRLISSDNKGVASQILERSVNTDQQTGKGPFVASFASTNLGDVSPNLDGPKCQDTGEPCNELHSTCNGRNEMCYALGPGRDMFESTWIIGERQAAVAQELLNSAATGQEIIGGIGYINQWVNMTYNEFDLPDGSSAMTCPAALGYGFAAGCTDGTGGFDFIQGSNKSNIFWDLMVRQFLKAPSREQKQCHAPKPVLITTGELSTPYQWHPDIVDTQIVTLGNFIIAAVPGELTTMAGRRMRETIKAAASEAGWDGDIEVVLAGLSNVYTHYITTFEEYQRQRYEAASTLYGPHTLSFYQQQYEYLIQSLIKENPVDPGPSPPDYYEEQFSMLPEPHVDILPKGNNFGDVISQPDELAQPGGSVSATFVGGNLRNHLMRGDSFLLIEAEIQTGKWETVYTDADWETKLKWKQGKEEGENIVEIEWDIPKNQTNGKYRIVHKGYETSSGSLLSYSGTSNIIVVQ